MAITGVTDYAKTYGTGRTDKGPRLTGDTQSYLKGLKEKYPNVNVTVADFGSEKQSDAYMLGSRGYNNIAVSPGILERMASDPKTAEKYEKVFAEMSGNTQRVEKFARENNQEILGAGAVIDKNGKVSYWMVGRSKDTRENPGTVYKEKVQKQIKEKRELKRQEEAIKEKRLRKAKTMEKLLEKVRSGKYGSQPVSYSKLQEEDKGTQLDLNV